MNQHPSYRPLLHRYAVLTICVTLVAVAVGALVTTQNAGMAFRDWPSSDGHNMLTYPWLKSAGDKFLEHGHRLSGMMIGLFSIGLTVLVWWQEPRRWARWVSSLVLLLVIAQGLLGGLRVLADDPRMAMVHGSFAACVVALMGSVAAFTSRGWFAIASRNESSHESVSNPQPNTVPPARPTGLKPWALALPVVVMAQYVLGGLVRHLGTAVFEHIGFAVFVLCYILALLFVTHRSGVGWLRQMAWALTILVLVQASLGLAAAVTRFGFAPLGYVAVSGSALQVVIRTTHTIVGMLLFVSSVVYTLRVFRYESLMPSQTISSGRTVPVSGQLPAGGAT